MNLQEKTVEIALSQVGIREDETNNTGKDIRKYLEATWMPDESIELGFPWCSAFITWVLKEARKQMDLTYKELDLYVGAKAYDWEKHAIKNNWSYYPEHMDTKPGDICTFDFSHIGIVIEDNNELIHTVEGNTNGAGTRDSDTGDGVWEKHRQRSLIKTFIRLPTFEI